MPRVQELPRELRPYQFLGLDIGYTTGASNVNTACPFCGRDGKLNITVEKGLWRCVVCNEGNPKGGGNSLSFIRKLWSMAVEAADDVSTLARDRGLKVETLCSWGVVRSPITGEWLLPGYGPDGKLNQLYRYTQITDRGKKRMGLLPCPSIWPDGQAHWLFCCPDDMDKSNKAEAVYVCEGPWDGMALWESLGQHKVGSGGNKGGTSYAPTSNTTSSLRSTSLVVAVPSCSVASARWAPLFSRKHVALLYDNDHPIVNQNTNQTIPPASYQGMRRMASMLARAEAPPASISYLNWGSSDTDTHNPDLKHGYDVRDLLHGATDVSPQERLGILMGNILPIPDDWIPGRSLEAIASGNPQMSLLDCDSWHTLVNAWRIAMKWTEGLDRAFSVMLAVAASTKLVGDPIWIKIVGPASCGKSTLCEALSTNEEYVLAKSIIRGFHSGFQTDKEGKQDNSLIAQVKDKTLITKDGDTLLQSPNLSQILAEARDLFDKTSRTHYRNRMGRVYTGINMTWILCGTSSLRQLDQSELGERFMDCVIMEGIDEDLEDEILLRIANRTRISMGRESNGDAETQHDPDLVQAMRLTGGYIAYLRSNIEALLAQVDADDSALHRCINLGKFVAYMRARPSSKQDETAEREMAGRLVAQMVRLANCLAVVLGRKSLDDEVMRRVSRVAMDTARGKTLELIAHLHQAEDGLSIGTLSLYTNETDDKLRTILRFLRRIGATESFQPPSPLGRGVARPRVRWRLTQRLRNLYNEVMVPGSPLTA